MKLDEAIKDLKARIDGEFYIKGKDDCADIRLGIEALKRCKTLAENSPLWAAKPLPGETEE